jgi:hypothetical protein
MLALRRYATLIAHLAQVPDDAQPPPVGTDGGVVDARASFLRGRTQLSDALAARQSVH